VKNDNEKYDKVIVTSFLKYGDIEYLSI